MDFLFSRTYKYKVDKPIDKVLQDFSKVTNKKWADFSENISGELNDDNSFKFTYQWTLGHIRGIFGSEFATIKGRINTVREVTIIETTLRPNFGLVFFLYFTIGLFLCELFGIKTMLNGSKTYHLLFLPFAVLVIVRLILFITNGLRNTFEKVFQLRAD